MRGGGGEGAGDGRGGTWLTWTEERMGGAVRVEARAMIICNACSAPEYCRGSVRGEPVQWKLQRSTP